MRLSQVSFRYSRRGPWVLKDIGLELRPGSVTEVTGRNGAGKSTLLRLLAGFVPPSRGTITERPGIVGYAPDVFPVDQPFTVAGYLVHMSRIRGVPAGSALDLAGRLNATHLLDQPLGDLSKGSAQKIGIVQSLLAPPDLLILDEPFAGLDEQTRTELPVIIEEIAGRGGTVVVSDHQKQLEHFPGADHWLVTDGTVTTGEGTADAVTSGAVTTGAVTTGAVTTGAVTTGAVTADTADAVTAGVRGNLRETSPGPSRQVIIEVIVDADDADEIEQKLRADGHTVRRAGGQIVRRSS